jgi:hypothetical protein
MTPTCDLLVGPDRRGVVGGGVDRETVVPALPDQVARERSDRIGSQPPPVDVLGEEEVDSRMAEVGLVLLELLDQADELAVHLDHKRFLVVTPFAFRRMSASSGVPHQRATPGSAWNSATRSTSSSRSGRSLTVWPSSVGRPIKPLTGGE